jgi:hypothetical protein
MNEISNLVFPLETGRVNKPPEYFVPGKPRSWSGPYPPAATAPALPSLPPLTAQEHADLAEYYTRKAKDAAKAAADAEKGTPKEKKQRDLVELYRRRAEEEAKIARNMRGTEPQTSTGGAGAGAGSTVSEPPTPAVIVGNRPPGTNGGKLETACVDDPLRPTCIIAGGARRRTRRRKRRSSRKRRTHSR